MEGFGQVILEYLSAGLPVAATALPPVTELVRDGREALLSPPRHPEQLAANIERLLLDEALARRLVAAGRERLQLFRLGRSRAGLRKDLCAAAGNGSGVIFGTFSLFRHL